MEKWVNEKDEIEMKRKIPNEEGMNQKQKKQEIK